MMEWNDVDVENLARKKLEKISAIKEKLCNNFVDPRSWIWIDLELRLIAS